MQLLDYGVLIGYFLIVMIVASLFSTSQRSLKDYFLGSRNIPWWAASFSGIATIASAISYIGAVGLGFTTDFSFLQYRMALPFAIFIICVIILPFFYNLRLYSIYEYLEKRFSLSVRLLGSALFILFKCCFLAIGIYAPAIIIGSLTGMDMIWIVLITGCITTLYTLLGGIKAVIWTDSLQLFVLLGGIFLVIGTGIAGVDGGFYKVIELGKESGKFNYFNFSFNLKDTYTLWGGIIGGTFLIISQFGTDQSELQRFLTVKSLRRSNLALISSLLVATLLGFLIFFEGAVLFAFYQERALADIPSNQVFVKFVLEELPAGIRGFLIAAIFAAAMSTISSILNSITTVALSDFYNRFREKEAGVGTARMLVSVLGTVCTLLACLGGYIGNILEAAMTVTNFFGGCLAGIFLLGMLSKKAGPKGALTGFLAGFLFVSLIAGFTDVAYMWYSAFGAVFTYLIGWFTSRMGRETLSPEQQRLIFTVRKPSPSHGPPRTGSRR